MKFWKAVLEIFNLTQNRDCASFYGVFPKWSVVPTPRGYKYIRTASSEFGTYRLCEQRRFRRACVSAQSRQNLRCSLIQALNQEEPSDRKPDPWPLWMAGHAQLKFVMMECSKTQIRLTGPIHLQYQTCNWLTIFSVNSKGDPLHRYDLLRNRCGFILASQNLSANFYLGQTSYTSSKSF